MGRYLTKRSTGLGVLLLSLLLTGMAAADERFDTVVTAHQKAILLLHHSTTRSGEASEHLVEVARSFYAEKTDALGALQLGLNDAAHDTSSSRPSDLTRDFLNYNNERKTLRDGDMLAFLDFVEELMFLEEDRGVPEAELQELRALSARIEAIYEEYREEYSRLTLLMGAPGTREKWAAYIGFLNRKYDVNKLVGKAPVLSETGIESLSKSRSSPGSDRGAENRAPLRVVLTFDDGPHRSRTEAILDALNEHGMQAHFFVCGRNVGRLDAGQGVLLHSRTLGTAQRILAEGHTISNHSYSHPQLTKLSLTEVALELESTNQLVSTLTGEDVAFFRPPYGSINSEIRQLVADLGMSTVLWNVDSRDWADFVPESIATRVLAGVERNGGGVVLLHDIHRQTVEAVPLILKGLRDAGYETVGLGQ